MKKEKEKILWLERFLLFFQKNILKSSSQSQDQVKS